MNKVEIIKIFDKDGHFFKVCLNGEMIKYFSFNPDRKEDEEETFKKALKLAKQIETGGFYEEVVYPIENKIQPIDYFMAANMSEEEIQNTIGVDLSKIDEDER